MFSIQFINVNLHDISYSILSCLVPMVVHVHQHLRPLILFNVFAYSKKYPRDQSLFICRARVNMRGGALKNSLVLSERREGGGV